MFHTILLFVISHHSQRHTIAGWWLYWICTKKHVTENGFINFFLKEIYWGKVGNFRRPFSSIIILLLILSRVYLNNWLSANLCVYACIIHNTYIIEQRERKIRSKKIEHRSFYMECLSSFWRNRTLNKIFECSSRWLMCTWTRMQKTYWIPKDMCKNKNEMILRHITTVIILIKKKRAAKMKKTCSGVWLDFAQVSPQSK